MGKPAQVTQAASNTELPSVDGLGDRELEQRIVEALQAVNDLRRRLAEATKTFNALHDEKDRRTVRRRAAR